MPSAAEPPAVPDERLADSGWELAKERTETVFEGLGVSVRSHTYIYEDVDLRERLVAAGSEDRVWRFFFTSRLEITPSPGFGMESVAMPHAVRESNKKFAEELRERGFENVEAGDTQQVQLDSRTDGRLTPHHARLPVGDAEVDIAGAMTIWYDGVFLSAGGAYPESGIGRWIDADTDVFETDLLELIQAVA
jgi:hypothetical protein